MQEYKIKCEKCGHWNTRTAIVFLIEEDKAVSEKFRKLFDEFSAEVSETTRPPVPPSER